MESQSEIEAKINTLEASGNATLSDIQQIKASINKQTHLPNFFREKYTQRLDQLREANSKKRVIPPRTRRAPIRKSLGLNESSSETKNTAARPAEENQESGSCADKEEECRSETLVFKDPQTDLKLSNLIDSEVTASNVESSVYCTNIRRSKLYISCQQCRLYDCHDVEIYLDKCTHPVIELSTGITFYADHPLSVSDFQWPNPILPSPNFSIGAATKSVSKREGTK